jgi:histidinol-phosphate aminotransferase
MEIKKLVKPNIRSLKAYQAGEVPCRIKLDANESPYGFRVLKSVMTNEYPDPEAKDLRKLFARGLRVKHENVLHGNGSDELIYYLITAFGSPVLYPVPTFSMYGIISRALGAKKIEIPLDDRFDIDVRAMSRIINKHRPKLIFLSSPNNPTGNCFSSERILKITSQSKGLVVVDEAYQPFSGNNDFLPLLDKHKNLIILRTLSKIGLAGLRVGFMIACREIINEVNKVRLPFNVNSLSQHVAIESLKNKGRMRANIRLIVSERKRLFREMDKIKDIRAYPSDANFILFKTADADSVYKGLLKKGVLIRNITGAVKGCLRVTIGTPGENNTFLKALNKLLS